jgi:hypothetical protein
MNSSGRVFSSVAPRTFIRQIGWRILQLDLLPRLTRMPSLPYCEIRTREVSFSLLGRRMLPQRKLSNHSNALFELKLSQGDNDFQTKCNYKRWSTADPHRCERDHARRTGIKGHRNRLHVWCIFESPLCNCFRVLRWYN